MKVLKMLELQAKLINKFFVKKTIYGLTCSAY